MRRLPTSQANRSQKGENLMLHAVLTMALEAPTVQPSTQKKFARAIKAIRKYGVARSKTKAIRAALKDLIGTFSSFEQFRHYCIDDMRAAFLEDRQAREEDPATTARIAEECKGAWKSAFRMLAKLVGLNDSDIRIFAVDGNRSGIYDVALIGKEDPWYRWVREGGRRYGITEPELMPLRKNEDVSDTSGEESASVADASESPINESPNIPFPAVASIDVQEMSIALPNLYGEESRIPLSELPQDPVLDTVASAADAVAQPEPAMITALQFTDLQCEPQSEPSLAAAMMQGQAESAATLQTIPAMQDEEGNEPFPMHRETAGSKASPHAEPGKEVRNRSPGQPAPCELDPPRKVVQANRRHIVLDVPVPGSDEWKYLQQIVASGGKRSAQAPASNAPQVA